MEIRSVSTFVLCSHNGFFIREGIVFRKDRGYTEYIIHVEREHGSTAQERNGNMHGDSDRVNEVVSLVSYT